MSASQVATVVADPASVDAAIESRFSCRAFLRDKPVARHLIEEILAVASRAPSGTNTQPWKVYVLQGASRDTLADKVCAAHDALYADPSLAEQYREEYDYYPTKWVSPYIDRRRENGWGLYGLLGIAKGEKDKMHAQHQRNFRFFDAPVGLLITIDRRLGPGQWADLGGYIHALAFLARGYGLDTCPQEAWARLYDTVGDFLKLPENEMLFCAVAIGYGDRKHKANDFRSPRAELSEFCKFYGFD